MAPRAAPRAPARAPAAIEKPITVAALDEAGTNSPTPATARPAKIRPMNPARMSTSTGMVMPPFRSTAFQIQQRQQDDDHADAVQAPDTPELEFAMIHDSGSFSLSLRSCEFVPLADNDVLVGVAQVCLECYVVPKGLSGLDQVVLRPNE
jgi:hypothetical protein